jgi:hypothetical protein
VLIAIAASGRSRLIAAGYALISTVAIVFLGILFLGRVPTPWHSLALSAAKPGANLQSIDNYRRTFTSMRLQNNPALAGQMQRYVDDYRLALQIHSLNAISVLAAGCIGALLGLWAYRRANPSTDGLASSR